VQEGDAARVAGKVDPDADLQGPEDPDRTSEREAHVLQETDGRHGSVPAMSHGQLKEVKMVAFNMLRAAA
jgi:hypothetical protein